jgi:hypothetical protein
VTLTARGQTPQDLIASATGRGSFAATDLRLALLSPGPLTTQLQDTLRTAGDKWAQTLRQDLAAHAAKAVTITAPPRAVDVDIKNGVFTLAPVAIDTAEGKVVGGASVDLTALTMAATWQVEAKGDVLPPPPGWSTTITPAGTTAPRKQVPPLPPILATWTAPLGAIETARLDVTTEALEREVTVRKVERDLEDLERLRKLDEERAKEEAERRRALEASAAAVPTGVAPGSGPALAPGGVPVAPGGGPTVAPGAAPAGAAPTGAAAALAADPSTEVLAVPDTVEPSLRPRPAAPTQAPPPAPKPAYRPLTGEEQRAIFNR